MSKLLLLRLVAGVDLIAGLETAAKQYSIANARIHAGPGSLMHANLRSAAGTIHAPGPAAEILLMAGEIQDGKVSLTGAVGDPDGRVYAGEFVRGQNPVCITVEVALECDLDGRLITSSSPATASSSTQ